MLYMNQKTYDELTEAIVMNQRAKFIPVEIGRIELPFGYLGQKFVIKDDVPDDIVRFITCDSHAFKDFKQIQHTLNTYLPDLWVV